MHMQALNETVEMGKEKFRPCQLGVALWELLCWEPVMSAAAGSIPWPWPCWWCFDMWCPVGAADLWRKPSCSKKYRFCDLYRKVGKNLRRQEECFNCSQDPYPYLRLFTSLTCWADSDASEQVAGFSKGHRRVWEALEGLRFLRENTRPRSQGPSSHVLRGLSKSHKLPGVSVLDCKIKWVDEIILEILNVKFDDDFNGNMGSLSKITQCGFWSESCRTNVLTDFREPKFLRKVERAGSKAITHLGIVVSCLM